MSEENKQFAIRELLADTIHSADYYALLFGAIFLAIGAIFTDSVPVLIASMIVAPLAMPILAIGLGITTANGRLVGRALGILIVSCMLASATALIITTAFGSDRVADTAISFSGNRDIAVLIAVVAGAIAAYGLVRPKVASAITGVAIAVSLMPPLVDTSIQLAVGNTELARDAAILFTLNVAGILAASIVVFACLGLRRTYRIMSIDQK